MFRYAVTSRASLKRALLCMLYTLLIPTRALPAEDRSEIDSFNADIDPNVETFYWAAIGDSFTAGPGAGERYNRGNLEDNKRCMRNMGSYAIQLADDWPWKDGPTPRLKYAACTGALTKDMGTQLDALSRDRNYQLVVMTLTGNDYLFGDVIKSCIIRPPFIAGNCEEVLRKVEAMFENHESIDKILHPVYSRLYNEILPHDPNSIIVHIGYHKFFDSQTDWCSDKSMGYTGGSKPKLTKELRARLNQLVTNLNAYLLWSVYRYTRLRKLVKDPSWMTEGKSRLYFLYPDFDPVNDYEGALKDHRFCERGVEDETFKDQRIWFLGPSWAEHDSSIGPTLGSFTAQYDVAACASDTKYQTDLEFKYGCDYAIAAGVEGNDANQQVLLPEYLVKLFHPKTSGFTAVKDILKKKLISVKDATSENVVCDDSSRWDRENFDPNNLEHLKAISNAPCNPPADQDQAPVPKEDSNMCHGVGGDYWVMHRDIAAGNVDVFCSQSSTSVEYNSGSVNYLRLSVEYPPESSQAPVDDPDCVGRFKNAVLDGCDGDDSINNPHNYKFGSTLKAADGKVYKMEPLSQQVNQVSCDISHRVVFNGFEIRGKNLPDAKFGASGEGLLQQLRGCGAVTKWHFERTPKHETYQWFASGQLPIGTKDCVGRALKSAGGSGIGNCHGSDWA